MERTYRFGLFGHPVKHSLSPAMHGASFQALGLRAEYVCFDVLPDELSERLEMCRREGFNGLNVTIPHKEAVVPLMGSLHSSARLYGAVNTVRFDAGGSTGYNTDATGFLTDLQVSRGVTPEGLRVLILGCGGAGRALAIACAREGALEIGLADLISPKAEVVAEEIRLGCPMRRRSWTCFRLSRMCGCATAASAIWSCIAPRQACMRTMRRLCRRRRSGRDNCCTIWSIPHASLPPCDPRRRLVPMR